MKKEYDLICSLGGNCAAAHNLLIRKLRQAAYPFDWIYFKSDEAVYKIFLFHAKKEFKTITPK